MTSTDLIRDALSWLATYALHSTLFLGVAWALTKTRRPRVPRNRERLWKLALVGGVLSATLQCALGARAPVGHIEWSTPSASVASAEPDLGSSPAPGATAPVERAAAAPSTTERSPTARKALLHSGPDGTPRLVQHERRTALDRAEVARPPALEPIASAPSELATPGRTGAAAPVVPRSPETSSTRLLAERFFRSLRQRWPSWIVGVWTLVGLVGLVGFACSMTALRRHLLGRALLREGPLPEMLTQLSARAGTRVRVTLSVSSRIATPFSTGLLRPEICLPRAVLTALTPAQQEALLAHELAHVLRRDPLWFTLTFLCERVLFFQPLNRLARTNLSELAELACDDWAVRWTGARLALASCLTEVAGWVVAREPRLTAVPSLAGSRSRLGLRVERLLDDRRSPAGEPPTPWWPTIAASSLAVAALALPGVSAQRPRPRSAPAERSVPERGAPVMADAAERISLGGSTPSPALPANRPDPLDPGELETELAALEADLALLQAELAARELPARFTAALKELQERLALLRAQHERAQALLARLATEPPTGASEPPAARPAPTALSGDNR
jgi:hypothetical protein